MPGPGQKWTDVSEEIASQIKDYLLKEGGSQDAKVTGAAEVWRIRLSDATITYYKSGTLYATASSDPVVHRTCQFICSKVGPRFARSSRELLIGLDETGKGEVIGHTVLVGVLVPAALAAELEAIVSVANTKERRDPSYWESLFQLIDKFKTKGLKSLMEKIPPWHIDRFNLNQIMDVVYQRILSVLRRGIDPGRYRVVVDDYGVGDSLTRYLTALRSSGAEVIVAPGADDHYVEGRVASILAKRERERMMEALQQAADYKIADRTVGSGNAGDAETLAWLEAWKGSGQNWPWFVKRSFKTVRNLDGLKGKAAKFRPPIRDDILSPSFIEEFNKGKLSVTSLSVVCPSCGAVSKAALVTPDTNGQFVGRCVNERCKRVIPDMGFTLRYYCGFILADANIITGGLLSKDLERSRFFEGFTLLLHAIVRRQECDTAGGKRELDRLAKFAAIGRISLEEVGTVLDGSASIDRDQAILESALEHNAILVTDDRNMKAAAQARNIFTLSTK
jgi:ribonuclease HII